MTQEKLVYYLNNKNIKKVKKILEYRQWLN